MAKFDIKTLEDLNKRKVILKKWARLSDNTQTVLLEILASEVQRTKIFRTCITCNHFEVLEPIGEGEQIERCKLVGKRPPAPVIADGCEKYVTGYYDDPDIPF